MTEEANKAAQTLAWERFLFHVGQGILQRLLTKGDVTMTALRIVSGLLLV